MTEAEKSGLRRQLKAMRRQLTRQEKESRSLAAGRLLLPLLSKAPMVFCYADLPEEMGTRFLLEQLLEQGTAAALPRVEGESIRFYRIRSFEDLTPGAMGIWEPGPHCPQAFCPQAPVVTPGLAFDRQGGRIGYGGGYYDRFFAEEPDHPAIGLCFSFQLMTTLLPMEPHDHRMNAVVTAQSVWLCS